MQLSAPPSATQDAYSIAVELESIAQHLIEQGNAALLRAEKLREQLSQVTQSELELLGPKTGNINRAVLLCTISERFDQYVKPASKYKVRDFRKFCEPFLRTHLTPADYELDADSRPKWHGRFDYAHKQVALHRGCSVASNGTWHSP